MEIELERPYYILVGSEDNQQVEGARDGKAPRLDYRLLSKHVSGIIVHGTPPPAQLRHWKPFAILRSLCGNTLLSIRLLSRLPENSIVFSTGETGGLPCALVGALLNRRRFAHFIYVHRVFSRPWCVLLRLLNPLLKVDGWICVTKKQKEVLQRTLGAGADVHVVSQGVDTRFFRPELAKSRPNNLPYILSIGAEMRDYALLFDAVRDLNSPVVIKASSRWIRAERNRLGDIPGNVTVIEKSMSYPELRNLYAQAAVVIVPLKNTLQAAGITTILEAMAMRKHVVATRSDGLPDILIDQETGTIVDSEASALSAKIKEVLLLTNHQEDLIDRANILVETTASIEKYASLVADIIIPRTNDRSLPQANIDEIAN